MLLRLPTTLPRCVALVLLTALSAGCQSSVPSIFLQMEDPTGIAPTQLRVTVRVEGLDTTSVVRPEVPGAPLVGAQTMRLLLPDSAVGHTAQLDIEALREGAVVGTALVSAAVVLGAETRVSVALNPGEPGCEGDACSCDASSCPNGCCVGNTCTMPSAAGACGTGGVACAPCPVETTDRCTDGACRCGAEFPCGEGYRCESGACVSISGGPACTGPGDCVSPPGQCFEAQGICGVDGTCTYTSRGAGTGCNDGDSCTDLDACDGLGACVGTPRVCTTPVGVCRESTGTCLGGGCLYALVPPGTGCDDGNACTTTDSCNDSGACGGTQITCNSPPGQCHQAAGTCLGGNCSYAFKNPGTTCDDGNACTNSDVCNGAGICGGTAVSCTSPNQCQQGPGTCSGGSCSYASKNAGSTCDDGNACTTSDVCNGSGACGGAAMICNTPPPGECYEPIGTCSGGSCSYALKTPGSTCNDGRECTENDACNASGVCAGTNVANFTPCGTDCSRCNNGTCSYACGPLQQCCPGDICQSNNQICGVEP
ncbi:MAG: hypothetical protein M3Y59_01085 [Myxococcota bacterium]|nr:hypothetical protein [Myxococcota bacterium]